MQQSRTPIHLYLEKLKAGDQSLLGKVCQQLADRLLYIPIVSGTEGKRSENKKLTFKVIREDSGGKQRMPVFTTQGAYSEWNKQRITPTEYISILGADFCGSLTSDAWIVVDLRSAHEMEFGPEEIKKIAISTSTDQAKADDDLPQPMFGQQVRGRSGPTSLMPRPERPKVDLEDTPKPRVAISTEPLGLPEASGLSIQEQLKRVKRESFPVYKPVAEVSEAAPSTEPSKPTIILSPDKDSNRVVREKEDPSKKKKRSFLNLLKGE